MAAEPLLRRAGIACMLAGVLIPLGMIVHPAVEDSATILRETDRLVVAHFISTAGLIALLLGLVGAYACQADCVGRAGMAGFLLAFAGSVLLAVSNDYGFMAPVLAARDPALLSAVNAYGPEMALNGLMVLGYMLGFMLFGVIVARASVLPRWAGAAVALGALLFLVGGAVEYGMDVSAAFLVAAGGQVLFGAGVFAWGVRLWSGVPEHYESDAHALS